MVVGLETKRKQLVSTSIVKVFFGATISFYIYIKYHDISYNICSTNVKFLSSTTHFSLLKITPSEFK